MAGMFGLTYVSTQEAVARFDFGRFRHIVDLGGAPGAFLVGVCQKFEKVRGTIFDLPTVEKVSNETLVRMAIDSSCVGSLRFASENVRQPVAERTLREDGGSVRHAGGWQRSRAA